MRRSNHQPSIYTATVLYIGENPIKPRSKSTQTSNRQPLGLPVWSVIHAIFRYAYNILWPHLMGPQYIIIYYILARHQSNRVWHKNKLKMMMRILILNGSSRCMSSKMTHP